MLPMPLEPLVGLTFGRIIFSIGVLSMCITTAVIEMLDLWIHP